jgi:hypothetical protein
VARRTGLFARSGGRAGRSCAVTVTGSADRSYVVRQLIDQQRIPVGDRAGAPHHERQPRTGCPPQVR